MVIISYIIKHIITNKNKILHKLFYALFAPYNKKKWKKYRICFRIHTEFYIYHLRKYRMNLRFTFYESLQAQCSKQEYKFVYKILYPIYSQSKKNDQKTDYRIITVSDRFHPSAPSHLEMPSGLSCSDGIMVMVCGRQAHRSLFFAWSGVAIWAAKL